MKKLLVMVSALTLGLLATGCGGSGGSDGGPTTTKAGPTTSRDTGGTTAEEYEAAFVVNLSSGSKADGNLVLSEADAACVAPRFVEAVTLDALRDGGVTTEDIEDPDFGGSDLGLTEAQGEQLVEAFGACDVDIVALFAESLTQGLTPEQQACAAENVDPDLTKALLVKTFSSGQSDAEFEAVLADLDEACDLPG